MSESVVHIALRDLFGVRSGDKGNISDLSLFADSPELYDAMCAEVTVQRVAEHFGAMVLGPIERFEVPNVMALKFVMHDALGGGGSASLRSDNLGKTLGGALLRMTIPIDVEVAKSSPRYGRRAPVVDTQQW